MRNSAEIYVELIQFAHIKLNLPIELLKDDPDFDEMNLDSLTKLEILYHADETYGSFVLEYLEEGLIAGDPPNQLSELAKLIPQCLVPTKEFILQRKKIDDKASVLANRTL